MSPLGWSEENTATFFRKSDVITAGDQRCIEFRHKADWGMGPHFSQRWEGVIPKGRRINVDNRCARHESRAAQMIDTTGVAHCFT